MIYDLAILGGGPAGVAAGVYAARKQLSTVFITKNWEGQSTVSEGIENWIGEVKISGLELSQKLEKHLKAYAGEIVHIHEGESVTAVKQENEKLFTITTDKDSYQAKTILLTTGSHRRKLEITGAAEYDNKGLTYCASCDGPLYSGQDVAVIGGGNAAFEAAAQLAAYCRSVTLLNRSANFRADPGTIETVSQNPKVHVVTMAVPKEVKGGKFVTNLIYTDTEKNQEVDLPVTGIFVEIGSLPNTSFLGNLVKLDPYNHVVTDARTQRTSLSGIWAAGDITDGLYHQNNIAAGDAVKAVEDIYLFLRAK